MTVSVVVFRLGNETLPAVIESDGKYSPLPTEFPKVMEPNPALMFKFPDA